MSTQPLVSCIMPTANRRKFIPRSIEYFLRQDYPEKELIILDDGEDCVADLIPDDSRIRYFRETKRKNVGTKRNALCKLAQGEIIAHWDDDDWYPPERLSRQVHALHTENADVVGSSQLFFLQNEGAHAWQYHYGGTDRPWVAGSTLVYWQKFWQRNPFPEKQIGEDSAFLWTPVAKRVSDLADPCLCIATIHSQNSSPKRPEGRFWKPIDAAVVHRLMKTPGETENLIVAPEHRFSRQPGLSVVIPHGGEVRLPQLAASLANLAQCQGIDEVIIVELGTRTYARSLALRWNARYVFVKHGGPFMRARALNIGTAIAAYELVMWKDSDLLLPPDFAALAQSEMARSALDFFLPYSRIHYMDPESSRQVMCGAMDPSACKPVEVWRGGVSSGGAGIVQATFVERYGGLEENFRGWGYEDTAWWFKARLLGRTAVTQNIQQVLYHLYHPRAVIEPELFAANKELYKHMQSCGSAESFLSRYPPPSFASCPWSVKLHLSFIAVPQLFTLAQEVANVLKKIYGIAIETQRYDPAMIRKIAVREPMSSAFIFFGSALIQNFVGKSSYAYLVEKSLFVVEPTMEDDEEMDSFRSENVRYWSLPSSLINQPQQLAISLIEPLSLLLGRPEEAAIELATPLKVWTYWEGPQPDWIAACLRTIGKHAPELHVLDPVSFDALRKYDRDIDLQPLHVAHRADFIRAYLLAHFGGLWIDADCLLMRPPTEVFERLVEMEFVAHQDRQGWFPNGFMAARPGSRIARELYERICKRLRSGVILGWTSLGGEPLTDILRKSTVSWYEMRCQRVQPVCWGTPEVFFQRSSALEHAKRLQSGALCYMLSNTEVCKYLAEHPDESLLTSDTFFQFLFTHAMRGVDELQTESTADPFLALPFMLECLEVLNPSRVLQVGTESVLWGALIREWWKRNEIAVAETSRLAAIQIAMSEDAVYGMDIFDHLYLLDEPLLSKDWCLAVFTTATIQQPLERLTPLLQLVLDSSAYVLIPADMSIFRNSVEVSFNARIVRKEERVGTSRGLLLSRTDPCGLYRPSVTQFAFERRLRECEACGLESLSGPGSTLAQTMELRQRLPLLLQHIGARTLLDAPCGDFNWMKHTVLGLDRYIGVDILETLVVRNREYHASPSRQFELRDIIRECLPQADVILCRDCLVHFSFEDIRQTLSNFRRSGARFLLTTTFPRVEINADIETGSWRTLNFELAPFHFPKPLAVINEKCTEGQGRYSDKSLGLWLLSETYW